MRMCEISGCGKPVFGTDRNTRIGYCKYHQSKRTDKKPKKIYAASSIKKNIGQIRTHVKRNQIIHENEIERRAELESWFEKVMKLIEKNPYCWECKKFISKSYYRAACAHILPKRKNFGFPSVATHDLNFLILGAGCGCHSKYDNSWDDASKMKVWPIAVERFKLIYPNINPSEHKYLPDILL
jgi:hypothetical protein